MDYLYNPTAKKSKEWTPLMLSIKRRMESIAGRLDGGLVQMYPHGKAGIGWHANKGKPEIIASLSFGAEREFAFGVGPASRCKEVWRMRLAHGSVLLIPSRTNEALKHRLPPAKRVKEPRVNVTLRRFPRCPLLKCEDEDVDGHLTAEPRGKFPRGSQQRFLERLEDFL